MIFDKIGNKNEIEYMNNRFIFSFVYNVDIIREIKTLTNYEWHGKSKLWFVHYDSKQHKPEIIDKINYIAGRFEFELTPNAESILNIEAQNAQGLIKREGNMLQISFNPTKGLLNRIEKIPSAKFNKKSGKWEIHHLALSYVKQAFPKFTLDKSVINHEEIVQQKYEELIEVLGDLNEIRFKDFPLFSHQKMAIHFGLRTHKMILADDMGLGKSASS